MNRLAFETTQARKHAMFWKVKKEEKGANTCSLPAVVRFNFNQEILRGNCSPLTGWTCLMTSQGVSSSCAGEFTWQKMQTIQNGKSNLHVCEKFPVFQV